MGRHDRKHGADAKAAVAHAVNVQGMTAEQVVALAAQGKLKAPGRRDRHRPFEIAESTVKEYAYRARRRRAAKSNGHHDDDEPAVALAVRDAEADAAQDPWEHPALKPLVERARAYDRALAEAQGCSSGRG